MKRFKNILVAYSDAVGAHDALSQATELAKRNRARLMIIEVFTPSNNLYAELRERKKKMQRVVNAVKYDGLAHVRGLVSAGDNAEEIIKQVLRDDHDLVIASTADGHPVYSALYGTLETQLMRKCPCPVWIVKPGQGKPYAKILAAVDPDPAKPDADPVNIKIMDLATSLARTHDAELHIVHAWQVTGPDKDTISSEVRDETRKALLEKHEAIHRNSVEALIGKYRFGGNGPVVHLPRGLPQYEIDRIITELGIDLTVMGMASRSGLAGFLIGNAAESILAGVSGGVLAVKPEDFRTPILLEEELSVA